VSRQFAVYHQEWTAQVSQALPHLSKPQAVVLALFSLGMVFARSCAVTAVAAYLALALERPPNTVRQQLREFCYEAKAKAGQHRREVEVEPCFLPLLGWIIDRWEGTQLALALDATTLADRFCVLVVSVVYRGCAIPVAWVVLPAGEKHAWRREWLRMLRLLHRAIPSGWTVLVLADRGLYARWLFRRIVRLGWHPFLRISRRGTFCPAFRPTDETRFWPLAAFAPKVGSAWAGRGTAFKTQDCHLVCTLLARWEEGHEDPWLILTDLDPTVCDVAWYGLRIWIERGFKSIKRGGWQWQNTRMTDPERAARLWLVVALATLWLICVGGEAEAAEPESACAALDVTLPSQKRKRRATRLRQVGVFQQGLIRVVLAMLDHEPLPFGRFRPEPWPRSQPLPNLATLDQPLASQNPTSQDTYP
jgi:Transposase DDE domain